MQVRKPFATPRSGHSDTTAYHCAHSAGRIRATSSVEISGEHAIVDFEYKAAEESGRFENERIGQRRLELELELESQWTRCHPA